VQYVHDSASERASKAKSQVVSIQISIYMYVGMHAYVKTLAWVFVIVSICTHANNGSLQTSVYGRLSFVTLTFCCG